MVTPSNRYRLLKNYYSYQRLNLKDRNLVRISAGLNLFNEQKSHLSFAIVRHPYERLISAFQSKFIKTDDFRFEERRKLVNGNFTKFLQIVCAENENCPIGKRNCTINFHWVPFYRRCDFCGVNYDVIIKLESHDQDINYVDPALQGKLGKLQKNPGLKKKSIGEYFAEVPDKLLKRLFAHYGLDFGLFGYDISVL